MAIINARPNTNKLIALIDDGMLDKDTVLLAALNWLSEDDVLEMAEQNDLMFDDDDGANNFYDEDDEDE